jgi:chromate reductase, NAD(P)H dehydrogenase (quinone)
MKILGISGSVRRGAYNTQTLRAAAAALPEGVDIVLWEGLKEIPAFDQDEEEFPPASVVALKEAIAEADGVLFSTPEYNHSVPGVLKNALDWVSRPLATSPLRNKPVAVIGASIGAFGAVWAQAELRKVLRAIGARVVECEFACGHAHERFDENGHLVDEPLNEQLVKVLEELLAEVHLRQEVAA